MSATILEENAWDFMDSYQPEKALEIWSLLIENAKDDEERDSYESNSCYALIALNRVDEARDIYLRLFNRNKNHRIAHQLCMVEREAGNFEKAIEYLHIEKQLIVEGDVLAEAANTYEFGKVHELMGEIVDAKKYAEKCIELSLKQSDLIMLACANRLLGDVYRHSDKDEAIMYYMQAQKIFFNAGDEVGVDEIDDLIDNLET